MQTQTQALSTFLKEKTQDSHDAAEQLMQAEKIFKGTFTFTDYLAMLQINAKLLQQFEPAVMAAIPDGLSKELHLSAREKLPLLRQDFAELDLPFPGPVLNAGIPDVHEALGILYVMEGATLGGQVIAKHLSKLPEFADHHFYFLKSYGKDTGPMWLQFKKVLDEKVQPADFDKVIAGAEKAYSFMLLHS